MTQDCLRKARVEPLKKMVIDVLPFPLRAVLIVGWVTMAVGFFLTPWVTLVTGLFTLPLNVAALSQVLVNADDSADIIADWMISLMCAAAFISSIIIVVA
ncbi:MAG TPA: hypothetical protein VLH77_02880 [Gammaproteobacteria bacterium]|nr:hypothetical protein [Gammaproteobacteria bacterium]